MAVRSDQKAMEIIEQCRKDMNAWYYWFSENNERWRQDTKFYFGEQWDTETLYEYEQKRKPTLVVDLIGPNIRKAMGQQKNADITVNLIPKNQDTDAEKFELIKGLVKDILYDNYSSEAFANVFEDQLSGGFGVLKIGTDYDGNMSFDQKIMVEALKQPVNAFFDPNAKMDCKLDGDFCGSYQVLSKEDFETEYPGADFPTRNILPQGAPQYLDGDRNSAVIVEYYRKQYKTKTLIELSNGIDFKKECFLDDKDDIENAYLALMEENNVPLIAIPPLVETNRRRTQVCHIKCYKLTMNQILEEYDWHIDMLPYFFVEGDSTWVEGRQWTKSFVSHAKDAQRIYNFVMSEVAYGLKTARKERFLMTPKQIEGHEKQYLYPEKVQGALLYNFDPQAGKPDQLGAQEVAQSYFTTGEMAAGDVQKTLGMIDPVNGGLINGASGQAIGRTIAEQNLNLVNYEQHLYDAVENIGRAILKLIPHIYDTERVVSIVDDEGNQVRQQINGYDDNDEPVNHLNELVDEVYDIHVGANMSASDELMAQHQLVMALAQDPQIKPYVIDLVAKTTKTGIGPELLQRLNYLVPEFVKEGAPQPPPMPQQDPAIALKQADLKLKEQQLAANSQKTVLDHQLEMQKLNQADREMYMEGAKAEMQSATDIQVAHDNNQTELLKSLTDLHKAMGKPVADKD